MDIKKFIDKAKDKIIIKEVDEDKKSSLVKPMSGYQSITSATSFKKTLHQNDEPGKTEYTFNTVTDETGKTLKFRKPVSEEVTEDAPENSHKDNFVLEVAGDMMSASLMVFKPDDSDITREELIKFLNDNGIVYGINEESVNKILAGKCFYEDVNIANGTPPVHGKDGYFEYTFNPNPETKPIIMPDGTVDYNTLGKYELVYKDQLLAVYHPLTPGKNGSNIKGEILKADDAIDLPPLKLNNVDYYKDTMEYYSCSEGKVTVKDGTLKVTPVFVVDGNLEAATGNVDFRGDIVVKGNVYSNVTIKATENITINGHVEIANLIAGRDIILKNGMQGSGIGKIKCGGNLTAKFLEQTDIVVDGNINTSAILNCNVTAGISINVSGKMGAILGGKVCAAEQITASTLGNRVGVATKIVVGLEKDFKLAMSEIDGKIEDCKSELEDAASEYERITERLKSSSSQTLTNDKMKYMRKKIMLQGKLNDLLNEKKYIADIRQRSLDGKVIVSGQVNTGTTVIINGISETVHTQYRNVTFSKLPKELRIKSNLIDDNAPRGKL
ncbi:MAG: FapA family protein [Lachnospiraceae bacterium]|nr:FapA family protein [Lachnospiraceae bacterium]